MLGITIIEKKRIRDKTRVNDVWFNQANLKLEILYKKIKIKIEQDDMTTKEEEEKWDE